MSNEYREYRPGDRHPAHRIRLTVMGISYSNVQRGAYAVLLAQTDGPYRIPVIVGTAEAQSIAFAVEGVKPPRPLTHDLFTAFAHACGQELLEVFIYRFDDGIFSSELTYCDAEGRRIVLDARTSDAIGLAVRSGAPIYTTPEILKETGFILDVQSIADDSDSDSEGILSDESEQTLTFGSGDPDDPASLPLEELEKMLQQHISNEEYEQAAVIKEIIAKRKNS